MSPLPDSGLAVAVDVVALTLCPAGDGLAPAFLARRREREPFQGGWSLPGGILREHEDLPEAVRRALSNAMPMEHVRHLEQLATFGEPGRDPRGRVLSVSYLALLPEPSATAPGAAWLDVADAPALAFDHAAILATAVERLRGKLSYSNVAYGLLSEQFTLSELQGVYEAVLGRELDKRNFRKKVLSVGMLDETAGVRRGPHRPAQLYRFRSPGLVLLDDPIG